MDTAHMILIDEFCKSHELEISFIRSLEDHGLIEIITIEQSLCIPHEELPKLEQMVRLHRELNVNPEGIDVVNNLLDRIEELNSEIIILRRQLNFFEDTSSGRI
jgi:hypothetical protein